MLEAIINCGWSIQLLCLHKKESWIGLVWREWQKSHPHQMLAWPLLQCSFSQLNWISPTRVTKIPCIFAISIQKKHLLQPSNICLSLSCYHSTRLSHLVQLDSKRIFVHLKILITSSISTPLSSLSCFSLLPNDTSLLPTQLYFRSIHHISLENQSIATPFNLKFD